MTYKIIVVERRTGMSKNSDSWDIKDQSKRVRVMTRIIQAVVYPAIILAALGFLSWLFLPFLKASFG